MSGNDNRTVIAYIGGGSFDFGWKLFSELSNEEIYAQVNLYDIDKQKSLANEVIGNKIRENPNCKADIIYLSSDTTEEALKNADIVLLSFSQGSADEIAEEINLAEKYGIYQGYGENAGPCGIMRALKTLPVYLDYAEMIKTICPDAWVINLSSPMALCMLTMYKVFPEIKLFGSSNENFGTQELLAELARKEFGIDRIRRREIKTCSIGISSFSWINEATYNGIDLFPVFRKYAEDYNENGYESRVNEYKTNPYASANKVKFDLFLRYGLIPAQPDRVVADFCPPWYLKSPKVISWWKFTPKSPAYIKKIVSEQLIRCKKLMNGTDHLNIGGNSSECGLQIKALLGKGNLITSVSMKNNGQVSNIKNGAIVETNALISKNQVKAVTAGSLGEEIMGLTLRHIINQDTIMKAIDEKDLDVAFNAFLNDSLMSLDLNSATEFYKEMLTVIRTHLLYYC